MCVYIFFMYVFYGTKSMQFVHPSSVPSRDRVGNSNVWISQSFIFSVGQITKAWLKSRPVFFFFLIHLQELFLLRTFYPSAWPCYFGKVSLTSHVLDFFDNAVFTFCHWWSVIADNYLGSYENILHQWESIFYHVLPMLMWNLPQKHLTLTLYSHNGENHDFLISVI